MKRADGAVVGGRPDSPCGEQPEGTAKRPHVLDRTAAEEENIRAGGFAHELRAVAQSFDIGFVGV